MPVSPILHRLYLIAVGAAVSTALLLAARAPSEEPPRQEPAPAADAVPSSPAAWLGEWEGRLAVFRGGAAPEEVFDVFVAALPRADQQALQARIPVKDEEELEKLLQDFSG